MVSLHSDRTVAKLLSHPDNICFQTSPIFISLILFSHLKAKIASDAESMEEDNPSPPHWKSIFLLGCELVMFIKHGPCMMQALGEALL